MISPCAGCISVHCVRYVSNLVQENYKNLSMVRIRPGAGCVSDQVPGEYQTWCKMRIRPGEECATAYKNLVQGMLSTDTGFFLDLGCRYIRT